MTKSDTIGLRLDRLSWSGFHTRVMFALGVGWLLDSFEVSIIGNVLGVLKTEWQLSDLQASGLVSIWLVGITLGALVFGYLADRFGRKRLFIITLLLYAISTLISAISPSYGIFIVFRLLTAIGVGAEYSAINAAIGELIPARVRGRASALVMCFWPLGSILAAFASLFFLNLLPPSLGWRLAFGFGAIMALVALWARRVLPESPRWLVSRGRADEAHAIVTQIEAGAPDFGPTGTVPSSPSNEPGFFRKLGLLFRHHPWRLGLGVALDLSGSIGYYGIFAFLPLIVLPRIHIADGQVPWFFLIGNVGALAGGLMVVALLDGAGRKVTVTLSYVLAAVAMLVMGWATVRGSSGLVLAAFVAANFFATMSWISAYPTFSEIFPTQLRSTGIGFSVAVGHLGAGLAPLALVAIARSTSIMASFAVLAGAYLLGAIVMIPWILKGPEGRGRSLEEMVA